MNQKRNIGIVTTWFERGAAYVSKQYMEVLQKEYNVYIYARSGESFAKGDEEWDAPNVYWSKKINSPFVVTVIDKGEFVNWVKTNKIEAILFNEQHWWEPLLWCDELNVKTIAYIDYYTEQTVPLFGMYDMLICNTLKHFEAFKWHKGAQYIPWGTDTNLFKPKEVKYRSNDIIFFHSCGMNPKRKGTDLLINAITSLDRTGYKVIIHTQTDLKKFFPELAPTIDKLEEERKLEIIHKTVNAPGLYYMGDIYVYPSRLEGIGLTVAEAISCGLVIVVPDCGPMNEFVTDQIGSKVKIDKYFCRQDGYYWPQNEVEISDLSNVMEYYIKNKNIVKDLKIKSRDYALSKLDWNKNVENLYAHFKDLLEQEVSDKSKCKAQIKKFENYGLRKYNKYYLKFPYAFSIINSIIKK